MGDEIEGKRYPLQGFITMRVNGLDGIVSRRLTREYLVKQEAEDAGMFGKGWKA